MDLETKIQNAIDKLAQGNRESITIDKNDEDTQIILTRNTDTLRVAVNTPQGRGIGDIEGTIERGIGEPITLSGSPQQGAYHGKFSYFKL